MRNGKKGSSAGAESHGGFTIQPYLLSAGRGKEQEAELIKLLSHLRSWDSFSKEGGLMGPKDTCFHPLSSPHLSCV